MYCSGDDALEMIVRVARPPMIAALCNAAHL
jgi:hypothetical protein